MEKTKFFWNDLLKMQKINKILTKFNGKGFIVMLLIAGVIGCLPFENLSIIVPKVAVWFVIVYTVILLAVVLRTLTLGIKEDKRERRIRMPDAFQELDPKTTISNKGVMK